MINVQFINKYDESIVEPRFLKLKDNYIFKLNDNEYKNKYIGKYRNLNNEDLTAVDEYVKKFEINPNRIQSIRKYKLSEHEDEIIIKLNSLNKQERIRESVKKLFKSNKNEINHEYLNRINKEIIKINENFYVCYDENILINELKDKIPIIKIKYYGKLNTKSKEIIETIGKKIRNILEGAYDVYDINHVVCFNDYLTYSKKFSIEFSFKIRNNYDIDNLVKPLIDKIFKEDSIIHELYANKIKVYDDKEEGFDMILYEIKGDILG